MAKVLSQTPMRGSSSSAGCLLRVDAVEKGLVILDDL
jgi:hypothetical protein